mmetsp:Transcript_13481/g.31706  ORF Transcript_13481/g.31706 Transcript_13481/m.31706 type:complete len:436 (-) Transcript_13481:14-1321(-)
MQRTIGKPSERSRDDGGDASDPPPLDIDIEASRMLARHRRREKKHQSSGTSRRRRWLPRRCCALSPLRAVVLGVVALALFSYQAWVIQRLLQIEQNIELLQSGKHHSSDDGDGDEGDEDEDDDEDENERQEREQGKQKGHGKGKGKGASADRSPGDAFRLEAQTFWAGTAHTLTAEERLQKLKPLVWIHIPFSGDRLLHTLLRHAGLCPALAADRVALDSLSQLDVSSLSTEDAALVQDHMQHCQGSFASRFESPPHHVGFGEAYLSHAGRGVIVLRQPEMRMLHAYLRQGAADNGLSAGMFAAQNAGCAVRMITRNGKDVCAEGTHLPTRREVDLAVRWLREGFAFVGIAESWSSSVCLFHAMFGGGCHPLELEQPQDDLSSPNRSLLQQMAPDQLDGALYREGLTRFKADLEKYDISEQSCAKLCPMQSPPQR